MNWTAQFLRTLEAGMFLFLCHSLSLFPLSSFPIWHLCPPSEDGGFPRAANLVTQYTGNQHCWAWVEESQEEEKRTKVNRQDSCLQWDRSVPGSGQMQRDLIHLFTHLFIQHGEDMEEVQFQKWWEEMTGILSCVTERNFPVTRQEKHEELLAPGEQDCLGHMSLLFPSSSSIAIVISFNGKSYICSQDS